MPPETEAPKIEIPSLASLTGQPDAASIVKPSDPAPPPVIEDGDKPVIPTDIFNEKPQKTPAQFAEERRNSKQNKVDKAVEAATSEWQQKFEAEMAQRLELEKRFQTLETEKKRFEQELPQFQSLAEQRLKENEEIRQNYFQTANSVVSPADDPDFVAAHQSLLGALKSNLPSMIQTNEGAKRVFFDQVAGDPNKLGQIEQALAIFDGAVQKADEATIDRAISYVGMLLGADVKLGGNPEEERLLDRASPEYQKINDALTAASPHIKAKAGRLQAIEQDRPALVKRKLEGKQTAIRGMLTEQIFMGDDQIKSALEADPTDGVAIISAMASRVPAIKERLEAAVSGLSSAFASVQDGFILPPPASNDPAAIKAHQEQSRAIHLQLGRAMKNAAAFEAVGPILAQVISERDSALSRLDKHSKLTNPGPSGERPGGAGEAKTSIPTDMFAV
jgi:hypothetical protein